MDESETDYPVMEPDKQKMDYLASAVQQKFGLELLGIDVIIENGTGRYGVIDINAFPGIFCILHRLWCERCGVNIQQVILIIHTDLRLGADAVMPLWYGMTQNLAQ